ncbi:MAG TPA: tripartite tricarboxylate transporter substrate binding protein [Xanthobacteraceae bacterium]|nr:tripartite tricarboxylate transporter substrate binding protein [Xanthobacteraceae bacterium]
MKLRRRQFLHLATTAAAFSAVPCAARADTYPSRPVRLIVGLPPGNSPDIVARLVGQWLSERLGQAFIVDNRPGAATNIGTEAVAHAAPDGYTLLLVTAGNAANAAIFKNLNYDFSRDIVPVASIGGVPFVMVVNPALPANTVPEFIAYAKANPGKIDMASSGNGSLLQLLGVLFQMMAGVELFHVPYRGSLFPDLLGGQVQVAFNPVPAVLGYIKAGKLRALGVSTRQRVPVLPDVPSLSEFLPRYEANGWLGLGAPKGTPADVVGTLNTAVNAGLADPALAARLTDLGAIVMPMTPAAFATFVVAETAKWAEVVKFADIKAE